MTTETTATTPAATPAATTVAVRRPAKDGVFSAFGSIIKSVSSVVSDVAITGSVASSGLMVAAERFKLDAGRDLIEEYGSEENLIKMQEATNALLDRIRNSR